MVKKKEEIEYMGRVLLFKNHGAVLSSEIESGAKDIVEILPIREIRQGNVITHSFVLPEKDATIMQSDEGMVYAYNVSLPYLKETAHLAEVEKNLVIDKAFNYPGRSNPGNKINIFQWVLVIFIFLMGIVAIMKG